MDGGVIDTLGNDSFTMREVRRDGGAFSNLTSNDAYDVSGGASLPDRAS